MRFPKLNVRPQSREFIQEFGGLDRRPRISENCFAEMQNLTGDHYPALSPRKKRGIIGTDKKYNAMLAAGEKMAYVVGNTLYWGEGEDAVTVDLVAGEDVKRQLVMMGAYIVVFPDAMYLNTADVNDCGAFWSTITSREGDKFTLQLCDDGGNKISLSEATFYIQDNDPVTLYFDSVEYKIYRGLSSEFELFGVPNPNIGCFSHYEIQIDGDGVEIVRSYSNYVKIKCVETATGALLIVRDTKTGQIVVAHYIVFLTSGQTSVTNNKLFEGGYCITQGKKGESPVLTKDGTQINAVTKITHKLFPDNHFYDSRELNINFHERIKGGYLPYFVGLPVGSIKAKFSEGAFWIDGVLNCASEIVVDGSQWDIDVDTPSFLPHIDYIIEAQNRLWGCRYGANVNGKLVNEIYASALGDFRQWYTFAGVSTDSYVASVGISGPFTGAVNYRGYPLFFKENAMFKVYGDYPENYQIISDTAMGLQKGCDKSLFVLSNTLYYRSPDGLFAYNGSSSERIDAVLGSEHYTDVVCCGTGTKLWASMVGEREDHSGLYVCDTEKGLWHKEDGVIAKHMVRFENDVYIADTARLFTVNGSAGDVEEDEVRFFAETGVIGYSTPDSKYVSRFALRVAVPHDGSLQIFVEYDSANVWEFKGSIEGNGMGTFTVPVVPRRCDHFRIRLAGKGNCRIFGFSKVLEEGGNV